MKRVLIIVVVVAAAVAAGIVVYRSELLRTDPDVTSVRYDVDADGEIELVQWQLGDAMVLWHWDRDGDGQPELAAYDAAVQPDGSLRPTGSITARDWAADGVIDQGTVPPEVERFLQTEPVAAALQTEPTGQLALVGPDIQALAEEIRAGYDDWRLSGFRMPIVGASLPDLDTLLPGAPRAYRNGVHQGFDMMNGHIGVPTAYSSPAVAAKAGRVVRVDLEYVENTPAEYTALIEASRGTGTTPPDVLDRLRGRQVWIDHGHGVMTRYCHLSGVAPDISEGQLIEAGEIVGFVGNSGMEAAASGSRDGAHLHFELRIDDRYLGEGLSASEIRALAGRILGVAPSSE